MGFRDDQRGQAIQVGAVLLFAVLIIAFSTYQAVIIPADNRRVEFNHNQDVRSQLADLRNAVLATTHATSARSVTVALGTQYPSRTLGLNPPPASGSLRTVGTADPLVNVSIRNATVEGEAGDFWDGTVLHYNSGGLRYVPNYHRYEEAPATVYEHSVLYDEFDDATLVRANQTVVSGNRISIVALNGSLSRTSSGPTTVDVRPISSSSETVLVEANDSDSPITLNFTSRLSADRWRTILSDEDNVESVTAYPSAAGGEFNAIEVTLNASVEYRLQMTKAAVGQGATDEDPAYLTTISGDGASILKGTDHQVTLAVRDRYNNPVAGVTVNGTVAGSNAGSLDATRETTGVDGRVTFTYSTTASTAPGTHDLEFTMKDAGVLSGGSFDAETTENVSMQVSVIERGGGGGSGAYTVDWTDPSSESTNGGDDFGSCDNESCVWDVGGSDDSSLVLNATLSPVFEGIQLEFAVTNSTIATVSPGSGTTGTDGAALTTLSANANGTLDVLASANADDDTIEIEVTNVSGGSGGGTTGPPTTMNGIRYNGNLGTTGSNSGLQFDIENVDSSFARINAVKIQGNGNDLAYLYDDTGREIEISGGDSPGHAPDQTRAQDAYANDDSSISFSQNAVLSTSSSGRTATVSISDFGSKSSPTSNSFTEYDLSGLQRVSGSDQWDIAVTLQMQNRGDIVYFFEEV